jgi:hypothetical protein
VIHLQSFFLLAADQYTFIDFIRRLNQEDFITLIRMLQALPNQRYDETTNKEQLASTELLLTLVSYSLSGKFDTSLSPTPRIELCISLSLSLCMFR